MDLHARSQARVGPARQNRGQTAGHARRERCLEVRVTAILLVSRNTARDGNWVRAGTKEAVFSSSEDRIRDGGTAAASIGPSVVQREARAGVAAVSIHRAAQSSFSHRFSSPCRICGLLLRNIAQLSFCPACLEAVEPTHQKPGSICGEAFVSSDMLSHEVLRRTRGPHSRLGLTSHQRHVNIRGACSVPRPQEVTGREVRLVDDVYTTGTTVSECVRVLGRAAETRKVWVASAARPLKLASKYQETDTVATPSEADFKASKSQGCKMVRNRSRLRTLKPCNLEPWQL